MGEVMRASYWFDPELSGALRGIPLSRLTSHGIV